MIHISKPEQCCGCSACASICGHNAIVMKPDVLGFLYPEVNINKCTNCGLCEKVCAFNINYDVSLNFPAPIAFGARQKKLDEVMQSRSGAIFAALSDYVLENGGVVYGAGYEKHFRVIHKRATTKKERDEFRGSKYVQSDMNTVFRQVNKDLKDGLLVLFTGTACQTSGLNSYIGRKMRERLILVDIVCHGVPSPFLWEDYLSFLENRQGDVIESLNFRDKVKYGWNTHRETFKFFKDQESKSFDYLFYKSLYFRRSCYTCHFTNTCRPSDITLADYWGIEKNLPEFNDNKGCNLILVNTPKGKNILESIQEKLFIKQVNLEKSLQPNLLNPTEKPPQRDHFESDYMRKGFEYVYFKYGEEGWRYKVALFHNKLIVKLKHIFRIK